jgi:hypothetical protein
MICHLNTILLVPSLQSTIHPSGRIPSLRKQKGRAHHEDLYLSSSQPSSSGKPLHIMDYVIARSGSVKAIDKQYDGSLKVAVGCLIYHLTLFELPTLATI